LLGEKCPVDCGQENKREQGVEGGFGGQIRGAEAPQRKGRGEYEEMGQSERSWSARSDGSSVRARLAMVARKGAASRRMAVGRPQRWLRGKMTRAARAVGMVQSSEVWW
jgi:hypothetical protein